MLPKDVEVLIKVIERINKTNTTFQLGEHPHVIANKVMFNQGVDSVIQTLKGVVSGNIKPADFLRGLEEEHGKE